MNTTEFIDCVKEALELEDRDVQMGDEFRLYEEWDSLTFLALMTLLRDEFGVSPDMDSFNRLQTWQDVYDLTQN